MTVTPTPDNAKPDGPVPATPQPEAKGQGTSKPDGPTPLLVLDVVGLTPRLLAHMPNLKSLAAAGSQATLGTVLPAVTCAAQSTFLTGTLPAEHGIVGNGWYFRELGDVLLWRQHNRLVSGDKLWDAARRVHPGYTVANICWWYAMGADTDIIVTPRPVYYADGRKEPDCYTRPPALHDELTEKFGTFPLFTFWGPGANLTSSQWIIDATRHIMRTRHPDLTLCYLPHLDYDLQRFGPDDPRSLKAARDIDAALAPLLADAKAEGRTVVALSEYGITRVSRHVDINRALRRAGLLEVHTQDGMEYLDTMASRAFAVADHQLAHIYVRSPEYMDATKQALEGLEGIDELLDDEGKKKHGLDHPRSGELVAVAEPDAWFTYYYWLDDERAPDFAQLVEIHRKPGYDPVELFMDPEDPYVRLKAAGALARKKLGMRYRMAVVPLDPSPIRGSHGRLPDDPQDGPLILISTPRAVDGSLRATDVKSLLLTLAGLG
ncbi:alkaline phosphatase family protein [Streptomyces indicus]|uniref:Predicted pyrophosphatase or phosphodiesterase, AlkP superfamily n=1 Tax=Streptomyces indicus TaxID=417292 RepID=A0A1G8UD68_9ACTN|nr:nucleotide pyrophosphatase/phosphodiesterase family protein [Streptomyces indicus]SDJ51703.1 Predicted pyrophosphatase or phosphodiesterase, AlkP superfamily [Streptomyces indicus]